MWTWLHVSYGTPQNGLQFCGCNYLGSELSESVIQNAVLVAIGKNHLNAEIAFHVAEKTRFGQLKNLSNAAISSQIGNILNHWSEFSQCLWYLFILTSGSGYGMFQLHLSWSLMALLMTFWRLIILQFSIHLVILAVHCMSSLSVVFELTFHQKSLQPLAEYTGKYAYR